MYGVLTEEPNGKPSCEDDEAAHPAADADEQARENSVQVKSYSLLRMQVLRRIISTVPLPLLPLNHWVGSVLERVGNPLTALLALGLTNSRKVLRKSRTDTKYNCHIS